MLSNYFESQADWSIKVGVALMPEFLSNAIIPDEKNKGKLGGLLYSTQYSASLIVLTPIFLASPVLKPLSDAAIGVGRVTKKTFGSVQKVFGGNR